ncbi:hypothetical protein ACTJIJ_22925 [Niabella sp. 22666]|uniref:hypothetical protein n=1 Tax=Niabella sp. 22666 TaxID=3453954 RepID=UPI003F857983
MIKGRNPKFIELRNRYLVKRYYFWYEVKRTRRDDVLNKLAYEEIFLDPEYINTLILQNSNLLTAIRRIAPKTEASVMAFNFERALTPQLELNIA